MTSAGGVAPFPPAKLSANRAIGNWLADLCKQDVTDAINADAELELLAKHVAQVVTEAYETGRRVEAARG